MLDVLEGERALEPMRRHGVRVWVLTSTGRRRLGHARRRGKVAELPESPQHRAWREAKTAAAAEMGGFFQSLRDSLGEAVRLLDAEPAVASDAWFELGVRLAHECRRVGSAIHCAREWPEPDDASADIDDHTDPADKRLSAEERRKRRARRMGRRNILLWDTQAQEAQ